MQNFRPVITFAVVCTAALGLSACERSVAGACTSAQDAAIKVSILADDLNSAQVAGAIDAARVGDLGARILDAGTKFGAKGNHQSYCTAIDKIRSEVFFH